MELAAPAIWLRDNCSCQQCRHANGQKLHEVLNRPDLRLVHPKPGDCLVFDNARMLRAHRVRLGGGAAPARLLRGHRRPGQHGGHAAKGTGMSTDFVAEFGELLAGKGGQDYLGEAVTIAVHSLQAGGLALRDDAPDALVAAALLHDIGHFTQAEHHDDAGADWLATWFSPEVTEPVRLHVQAKRYLCAVQPSYAGLLSPASVHSLSFQGGPMTADEVARFEANPYHRDAVAVRRWDDEAKDPDAQTPDYAVFVPILAGLAS